MLIVANDWPEIVSEPFAEIAMLYGNIDVIVGASKLKRLSTVPMIACAVGSYDNPEPKALPELDAKVVMPSQPPSQPPCKKPRLLRPAVFESNDAPARIEALKQGLAQISLDGTDRHLQ